MTREEVVKWLESLRKETGKAENRTLWHYAESIDMAIKALKEKNRSDSLVRGEVDACKESESKLDLISRQAALDAIMGEPTDAHYPSWYAQKIKLLPSATCDDCIWHICNYNQIDWEMVDTMAEPKTGEWIPVIDIRKLEDVVYMHIDSLEGTRNIVEAGMLSAWKEVAEYLDGMLGEDGEE